MREFNPQVLRAFNLKVKSSKRAFGSHICETNKGIKIVKVENLSNESIQFVHSAKEHLYGKGFTNIDRYNLSHSGQPYYEFNRKTYVVKDWLDGEECNFQDKEQILLATKNLALFHQAAIHLVPEEGSRIVNKLGGLPEAFGRHYKELTYMYKKIRKNSRWNDIDLMFIKNYKDYMEDAKEAIDAMSKVNYDKVLEKAKENKVFCHDKFTNHNLQIRDNNFMITNFEYICFKIQLYDLLRFFEKVMRKMDWDQELGMLLLKTYNDVKGFTDEEYKIFYAMLLFPDKYWRLSNQHYNTRRHWMPKVCYVKMNELIEQKDLKKDFLKVMKEGLY